MLFFLFPDGQKINAAAILSYYASGGPPVTNLTWDYIAGGSSGGWTGAAGNTNAPAILAVMIKIMDEAYLSGAQGIVPVYALPILITSCNPNTFAHGASPVLDVFGTGFYPGMNTGNIWVEDLEGSQDSNGMSFTVAYDTPTHLVATWASNGDNQANTQNPALLYFQDVSGLISNYILCVTT